MLHEPPSSPSKTRVIWRVGDRIGLIDTSHPTLASVSRPAERELTGAPMSSGNDRAPNVIPCGEKAPARCIYLQEIVLVRGRDHRIKVERFETPKLACASSGPAHAATCTHAVPGQCRGFLYMSGFLRGLLYS